MQGVFKLAVVFVGDEIGDGLAEVPQEAVAGFGALDHAAGKHGHPGCGIVAAQLFELRDHVVSPVLRSGFPTVVDYEANASLAHQFGADGFLVAVEVRLEVLLHKAAIEFVDLKARSFGGGGVVGDAEQRVAEAQHDPVARRAESSRGCRQAASSR